MNHSSFIIQQPQQPTRYVHNNQQQHHQHQYPKRRKKCKVLVLLRWFAVVSTIVVILLPYLFSGFFNVDSIQGNKSKAKKSKLDAPSSTVDVDIVSTTSESNSTTSCAICFFGLPRSFKLLVLPSIIQNVLVPNLKYRCDIYLHYYDIQSEGKGRSGAGGRIDTTEVLQLQEVVDRIYNNNNQQVETTTMMKRATKPRVQVTMIKDTNETFWEQYKDPIQKYMTETNVSTGQLLYYPWMAKSYDTNSVINLIKQWHSIQSVWKAMEEGAHLHHHHHHGRMYDRVAMLRNDVVFVNPFDMYMVNDTFRDTYNKIVTVPNWARFPINDRMVYGPASAVKVWATERFIRLEDHVRTYPEPGYGLHSERFLESAIFTKAIRGELGFEVGVNPNICFFRARADGSCWINDCVTRNGAALGFRTIDTQKLVEGIVGKKCVKSKYSKRIVQLQCKP